MGTWDFLGHDIVKMLGNKGNFEWIRTTGDHTILKWEHPDGPEIESLTVSVPLHDQVRIGTLRGIADNAGAKRL